MSTELTITRIFLPQIPPTRTLDSLPTELLFKIFQKVTSPSLQNIAESCRLFRAICKENFLWQSLVRKCYPLHYENPVKFSFKSICYNCKWERTNLLHNRCLFTPLLELPGKIHSFSVLKGKLAVGLKSGEVSIFQLKTRSEIRTFACYTPVDTKPAHHEIKMIQMYKRFLATLSKGWELKIFDRKSAEEFKLKLEILNSFSCFTFAKNKLYAANFSSILIFDLEKQPRHWAALYVPAENPVKEMRVQRNLLICNGYRNIRVYDLRTHTLLHDFPTGRGNQMPLMVLRKTCIYIKSNRPALMSYKNSCSFDVNCHALESDEKFIYVAGDRVIHLIDNRITLEKGAFLPLMQLPLPISNKVNISELQKRGNYLFARAGQDLIGAWTILPPKSRVDSATSDLV